MNPTMPSILKICAAAAPKLRLIQSQQIVNL